MSLVPAPAHPTRRLLPVLCGVALLTGCGSPPDPLPTAPPAPRASGSLDPSGVPFPSGPGPGGLPTNGAPTGLLPTGALPPGGLPTYRIPTLPTTRTPSPSPTRSLPPAAPVCTGAPTQKQILDLIRGKPGLPDEPLEVRFGPYCAGNWQFTAVGLVGETDDEEERLLVVTSGRPTSPRLVEAGTDVCTDRVEDDAPPGIRVRACGF
jgi:hypothetical protein